MSRIEVRGKNIEVTPALREYAEKRLSKITRHFEKIDDIMVRLAVVKDEQIVEVTMQIGGIVLRSEDRQDDMYAAIDLVVDKLERQIRKYKTKLSKRIRVKQIAVENSKTEALAPVQHEESLIPVKVKKFALSPMNLEEAILQMNLLEHEFYAFKNQSDDNAFAIVYRRKNGGYGLISDAD